MTDMELYKYLRSYCKKVAAEGRPFEDSFSAFQNEMVRQSIDYAEKRAEKIYIYSDLEDGAIMARPAFRINGRFYPDYEWDKAIRDGKETSSLSREEKRDIRRTILCYAVAVRWLCKEYGKPIPTVIKLVYDAKKRRVDAKYGYERLRSLSDTEPEVRCRMWFDEIRENNL